jgi:hypothetical protein
MYCVYISTKQNYPQKWTNNRNVVLFFIASSESRGHPEKVNNFRNFCFSSYLD